MNIDPDFAICTYSNDPRQVMDYIINSLGFVVHVYGPNNNISIFLFDNDKKPLIELYYCWNCFYLWTNGDPRLLDDEYCVNYTPVSNIINRFMHVYHNYRRQQKIDHKEDIKQAGLVYDV